jgi:hypothetical protein
LHAKGDDRLDLEPAQMAEYLEAARVLRARQLLEESAGRQLSRAESTDRNCINPTKECKYTRSVAGLTLKNVKLKIMYYV